jgi:hypothetical protein
MLFLEVAVLDHTGELDDALQLQLAPTAANTRTSERIDQSPGLRPKVLAGGIEQGDALQQHGIVLYPAALRLLDLAVDLLERLGHRREKVLDRLLAKLEIRRRLSAGIAEAYFGQIQKSSIVGREGFGRECLKGLAQLRADILVCPQSLGLNGAVVFEFGLKTGLPCSRDQPSDKASQG